MCRARRRPPKNSEFVRARGDGGVGVTEIRRPQLDRCLDADGRRGSREAVSGSAKPSDARVSTRTISRPRQGPAAGKHRHVARLRPPKRQPWAQPCESTFWAIESSTGWLRTSGRARRRSCCRSWPTPRACPSSRSTWWSRTPIRRGRRELVGLAVNVRPRPCGPLRGVGTPCENRRLGQCRCGRHSTTERRRPAHL